MKPKKSFQGMEQLLYPRNSSLNSAAEGHIFDRTGLNSAPGGHIVDLSGAHQITRRLAYTHLKPQPDLPPQPDMQVFPSNSEMCCFVPESNDYWDSELECEEFNPSLWQQLALVALEYYHEKQGVELELNGEIIAPSYHYGGGIGFHLGFQANDSTGSPKKIFAEVFRFTKSGKCRVLFCDIMDPNDPDLLKGCRFCPSLVLHPKGMKFFKRPFEWSDDASAFSPVLVRPKGMRVFKRVSESSDASV